MTNDEVLEVLGRGNAARAQAKALFREAYDGAESDVARCWAAHMVALDEDVPEEKLRWNLESLRAAEAVEGAEATSLLPTVLANIGLSELLMARPTTASDWYEKALASLASADLPEDRRAVYRVGIEHMLTVIRAAAIR